jgi:hypothetical protein
MFIGIEKPILHRAMEQFSDIYKIILKSSLILNNACAGFRLFVIFAGAEDEIQALQGNQQIPQHLTQSSSVIGSRDSNSEIIPASNIYLIKLNIIRQILKLRSYQRT